MRISNCLHPVKVFNRYTQSFEYVPCRKCEPCLNIRSYSWQQRITEESRNSPFSVFFTLTYNDDSIPRLYKSELGFYEGKRITKVVKYIPKVGHVVQTMVESSGLFIPYEELDFSDQKDVDYVNNYEWFSFPCVSDIQKFVKRLRSKAHELFKKDISDGKEVRKEDYKIRYCIVSEYTPNGFRIHYHGLLWFSSRELAAQIENFIRESWLLCDRDCIDVRFSDTGTSQYVSKYISGTYHLPSVYRHRETKPFLLSSRHPFVGHSAFSTVQIKEIIHNSDVQFAYYDPKSRQNRFTFFPRSFEDRYFPKCWHFSQFSLADRILLYTISRRIHFKGEFEVKLNFDQFYRIVSHCDRFKELIEFPVQSLLHRISNIVKCIYKDSFSYGFKVTMFSIYKTSKSFLNRCFELHLDPIYYVYKIDSYYSNLSMFKLRQQYEFMIDYSKDHDPVDLSALFPFSCQDFYDTLENSYDYRTMKSLNHKIHLDMENNKKRKAFYRQQKMKKFNIRHYE